MEQKQAELPFKSEEFKQKWAEWLMYRREELGLKAYKERGEKRVLKYLVGISLNDEIIAIQIIDQSMVQQYQGLFPLKNIMNGQPTNNGSNSSGTITRIQALKEW